MRTLVVGIGNPILRDDAVGWRVVEQVQARWRASADEVNFDFCCLGGLSLMETLVGYDRAILVDAIVTRDGKQGTIYRLTPEDLPTFNADGIHDASLRQALDLGHRLGASLPGEIAIVAIEASDLWDFGEFLSPEVAAAVEPAVKAVLDELRCVE